MRTIPYVLIAFALSSCAGHSFMKQKYTHFAHSKNHSKIAVPAPSSKEPVNSSSSEKLSVVTEEKQETFLPSEKTAGESSVPGLPSFYQEMKKTNTKKQAIELQKTQLVPVHGSSVQQKARTTHARPFHHMTPFEEFMLAFVLIFIFFLLPAAFVTGIVWMFFNFWTGFIIAISAAVIFGTIALIGAYS